MGFLKGGEGREGEYLLKPPKSGTAVRAPELKSVVVLGSLEFNSSATLVNSQLVCFLPIRTFYCYAQLKLFVFEV